jgi:hypothetical protein
MEIDRLRPAEELLEIDAKSAERHPSEDGEQYGPDHITEQDEIDDIFAQPEESNGFIFVQRIR